MPGLMAKHKCKAPGCGKLVYETYCLRHARREEDQRKERARSRDKARPSASKRLYDRRWQRYRRVFLVDNPFCVRCLAKDRLTPSVVPDHIEPHKGDYDKFWDEENHQALCKRCHDIKTATEDGGFGRKMTKKTRG